MPIAIVTGAKPRTVAVQDIGAGANRVECATNGVDQETVARAGFHSPHNVFVHPFFANEPAKAADWRHNNIDLSDPGEAVFRSAGPCAIAVPGLASLSAVFFHGDFADRSQIPLRAVDGVPDGGFEAAAPVSFGIGKLHALGLGVVLNPDVAGERALHRMADVAEHIRVAVAPARVLPRMKRLHVVSPIVIEGNAVFGNYPAEIGVNYIRLLDYQQSGRFLERSAPMKTFFLLLRNSSAECGSRVEARCGRLVAKVDGIVSTAKIPGIGVGGFADGRAVFALSIHNGLAKR